MTQKIDSKGEKPRSVRQECGFGNKKREIDRKIDTTGKNQRLKTGQTDPVVVMERESPIKSN